MRGQSVSKDYWVRRRCDEFDQEHEAVVDPAEDRQIQARVLRAYAEISEKRIGVLVDAGMIESGGLTLKVEERNSLK